MIRVFYRRWVVFNGLIFVLLCAASCDDYRADRTMNRIETFIETYPDSARMMLEELEAHYIMGKQTDARRCMMLGRVYDEQQKTVWVSNPLLTQQWLKARDYYDRYGTPVEQARIRLYVGRSQKDDGQYAAAAETYKEAIGKAEKNDDYSLTGYLYSYLADLYLQQELYKQAREKYEQAVALHAKSGNLRSQALAMRSIVYSFLGEDKIENALFTLHQADSIVKLTTDSMAVDAIASDFGIVYYEIGELDKAETCLLNHLSEEDPCPTYLALADVYIAKKDYEKARYYSKMALSHKTEEGVLLQHYLIEKAKNNPNKAIEYLEDYVEHLDSAYAEQNKIKVHEVERRYDKRWLENENIRLRISILRLAIITIILLVLFASLFLLFRHNKNRQIYGLREALRQKENELCVLTAQLKMKEKILGDRNMQETDYLQAKEKVSSLGKSLSEMKRQMLYATSAGKKILHVVREGALSKTNPLSGRDWKALDENVKLLHPVVYAFFQDRVSIDKSDIYLRLCLLSFFDTDTKVEAFLLNLTDDNAARQWRFRLRKLLEIEGKQSIFDYFRNMDAKSNE